MRKKNPTNFFFFPSNPKKPQQGNFSIPGPALANISFVDRFLNSTQVKWAQLGSNVSSFQTFYDRGASRQVVPASPEITAAFKAALPSANALGNAYKKRVPAVPAIPTDPLPGLTASGTQFWNAVNNNSVALQFTGKVREREEKYLFVSSLFFSFFQPPEIALARAFCFFFL